MWFYWSLTNPYWRGHCCCRAFRGGDQTDWGMCRVCWWAAPSWVGREQHEWWACQENDPQSCSIKTTGYNAQGHEKVMIVDKAEQSSPDASGLDSVSINMMHDFLNEFVTHRWKVQKRVGLKTSYLCLAVATFKQLERWGSSTWLASDMRKSILAPGSARSRYVLTSLRSALLPSRPCTQTMRCTPSSTAVSLVRETLSEKERSKHALSVGQKYGVVEIWDGKSLKI